MLAERLTRAFWPAASLTFVAWSLAAFGLTDALGHGALLAVIAATAAAFAVLVWRGAAGLRWPSEDDALARLDRELPGRPLAALTDAQALGRDDPASATIWAAHRARMARAARAARAAWPDLRLASRDPWAVRLMALVMLLAALVFARGDGIETVGAALVAPGAASVAAGPSYEAWAEPPAYTGRPTLYLPEVSGDRPVDVPQGTRVSVRVYGEAAGFALTETVAGAPHLGIVDAAEGIATAAFPVDRSGSVALREGERPLGEWSFAMQPDAPPTIALAGPVERATGGSTRLAYTANDDYGVTAARAEVRLDLARVERRYGLAAEPVEPPVLAIDLPMPLTGGGAPEIAETLVEDFTKHPLAGLPVRITLTAEDAVAQVGVAPEAEAVLPRRRFFDPTAAALVEQRRDILWSPENAPRVIQVLRAVTYRPEDTFDSDRAYLLARTAVRWLARAEAEGTVPVVTAEVAETLWQAALLLEDGSLGDAAERLARAQERLQEALQGDASDEEIAELMEELREATRDYMEQLAEQALREGSEQADAGEPGQTMSQNQIQELMDRIQELSEQGRRAEAEQLLEMLRQMLENMEMRLAEGGQGQGQNGQGQQMMQDLADTLRQQQGLADESFQQLQREFRQNRQGQPGGQPGEGQGQPGGPGEGMAGTPSPEELAERQEALRELLDELRDGLPGTASEEGEAARKALGDAERSMGEAGEALRDGDTSSALDRQAEAIDNLREGMRGLGEEMRQAQEGGSDQMGQEQGDAFANGRNDPLGRPTGSRGNIGTSESMVPEADARARARELLDEIRRRAGDLSRPDVELDYLRRLLERF
jgi:uncharacterized protein (TIGR02302 family)